MSGNPANGKTRAFDLDAAAREAAASEGEPFAFTWKGTAYTLPPQAQWPMQAVRLLAAGDINGAMAELMGEAEYDALCQSGLTLGDMTRLFEEVGNSAGMGGLPNSSPPARAGSTRT